MSVRGLQGHDLKNQNVDKAPLQCYFWIRASLKSISYNHDGLFIFSDLWISNFVLNVYSSRITCLFYFSGIETRSAQGCLETGFLEKLEIFSQPLGGWGSANPKLLSFFSQNQIFLGTLLKCDETQRNMPKIA